ncbi:MAG: NADH-quinone oxidoreductase subunit C, partial [Hydrogenobaculum sp.]
MPWASSQTLDRIKHTFRKISIDTQPNFVCINVEDTQEITNILKHLKDVEDFRYFIDFHVIDFPK